MSVTPLPGTYHQRGGRPVRQPRISGHTSRQCNMMEIITQSSTKSATNGLQGHQGITENHAKHGSGQSLTGSGRRLRQRLGAAPLHRHLAGLLIPSMRLLHLLAKEEDDSSPISGHNHKAREYIIMHSASIATYYKQSNNHATLEIKSYNMARSTLNT